MTISNIYGHGTVNEHEELVQNVVRKNNGVEMEYQMDENYVMTVIITTMMPVRIIVSLH